MGVQLSILSSNLVTFSEIYFLATECWFGVDDLTIGWICCELIIEVFITLC